ncbi:MAG: (d)CMP kinase [Rhodospirillales bacterium]|nr:(d)CMP kinase [Rhodospirillales bacterium]
MIVAIDGPAAAGKGTLARRISEHLNLAYLDTGLLYRAVGKKVLDAGADPDDAVIAEQVARTLQPGDLQADGLRVDAVGQAASRVSAVAAVRAALLDFQKDFAANPPAGFSGVVLDGRDIGTVVCPAATAKLFITASTEVRAKRRFKELHAADSTVIYARVLEDMKERDARDQSRAVAPLEPAQDAKILDTSALDSEQVFDQALAFIASKSQKA